eukprot:279138_1
MEHSTDGSQQKQTKMAILLFLSFISFLVVIPTTLLIIYHYCKNKSHLNQNPTIFKTGFCYFLFTLLFCINYCCKLYQHMSGKVENEHIFMVSTYLFYNIHFILLICLLFGRIFYIFHETTYYLSKK